VVQLELVQEVVSFRAFTLLGGQQFLMGGGRVLFHG
jgi:hypothetical protein